MSARYDVAIVGAGPYALSTAAFLQSAGADVRVFGSVMGFWETMPKGMFLRSYRSASSIADANRSFTLERYEAALGRQIGSPLPLEEFIQYGRWFGEQAVDEVDPRRVILVRKHGQLFSLSLHDGEVVHARHVVVAAGIAPFAWRPPEFERLPSDLVSHSSEHRLFDRFAGRRVLVVGGGQSALESAALLQEAGAEAEVFVRASALRFLRGERLYGASGVLRDLLYPPLGVGPPGLNLIMGHPRIYRLLPRALSAPLAQRTIRPAAAAWLRRRLENVSITTGRFVTSASATNRHVCLRLDDGSERSGDHVLLGTGYRIDVRRYEFLDSRLGRALRTSDGYPVLSREFESSVEGLHFLGAAAAASAGPGMRFVSHTGPAAAAVTRSVLRRPIKTSDKRGRSA